jgi:ketosteroid isomerase-like protein
MLRANEEEVLSMETEIVEVIKKLEEAANQANPSIAEAVLWLHDDRFSEIEDFIPEPMGAQGVRRIHEWVRENGRPGDNMHFRDIRVHSLSPEVVYATAIQELRFDEPGASRVTFVLLRQDGAWGVIHAHYSTMPPPPQ